MQFNEETISNFLSSKKCWCHDISIIKEGYTTASSYCFVLGVYCSYCYQWHIFMYSANKSVKNNQENPTQNCCKQINYCLTKWELYTPNLSGGASWWCWLLLKLEVVSCWKETNLHKVGSKSSKFDHKLAEHWRGLSAKNIRNTYKTSCMKCVI